MLCASAEIGCSFQNFVSMNEGRGGGGVKKGRYNDYIFSGSPLGYYLLQRSSCMHAQAWQQLMYVFSSKLNIPDCHCIQII